MSPGAVVLIHTAGLTFIIDDLRNTAVWWVASVATISTKWSVPVFVRPRSCDGFPCCAEPCDLASS